MESPSLPLRILSAVNRALGKLLFGLKRVLGLAAQRVQHDQLRELTDETRVLGSASAESINHVGAELREINERLAKLEREIERIGNRLEGNGAGDAHGGQVERSAGAVPLDGLRMELAPGSVWVDAQGAQSVHYAERGIGRYIGEQISAVTELAPGAIGSVHLDPDQSIPSVMDPLIGSGLLHWAPNRSAPEAGLPAIYHVTSPMDLTASLDDLWPSWARSPRVGTVVTLYDFIPLIFRDRYLDELPVTRAAYFARLGLLRRADHALAISERTAQDAIEHLGMPESRITVIDCGVSDRFSSLLGSRQEAEQGLRLDFPRLRSGFVLYVGGDDPRKNLLGAIEGYALLGEETRRAHQLVIVCKLSDARIDELTAYAVERGIDPGDVLFTGYVLDPQLAALYRELRPLPLPLPVRGCRPADP